MRPISLKALTGSLFMTLCAAATALSATTEADSLSAALSRARTPAEREQTYVRLADLCTDSTALAAVYWEAALTEAAGAGDDYGCREALDRLVQGFSAKQPERALEYVRLADSLLPDRRFALFRASLNAFWLWKQMSVANSFEAIDRALAEFRERQPGSLTPEEEIEWEFLTGLSIDYSSIATEAYGNILQAIPYVEQALAKLEKYPLEERVHFEKLCREELADIYLYADDPRAAGQIGRCIDLHRAWMAADTRFERPRRDSSEYLMRSYGKMVFLGDLLAREEVDDYYNKCMELARGRGDREEIYNTSARYYRDRGDYERTAAYMDSLLTHYAQTGKKADLGSIYIAQSHMYEKVGDYEKALKAVREGNDFRYYSRMDQAQSKLAEMQALYDVNRLELEKVRLADRSKFFLLMAGGIVLLLLAGWAVYQQAMVRRLKLARTQFMAASEEPPRPGERTDEDRLHQLDVPRDTHAAERHQRLFRTAAHGTGPRGPAGLSDRDREEHQGPDRPAGKHAGTFAAHQHRRPAPGRPDRHLPALRRTAGAAEAARRQSGGRLRLRSGGRGHRDTHQRLLPDARPRQPAA